MSPVRPQQPDPGRRNGHVAPAAAQTPGSKVERATAPEIIHALNRLPCGLYVMTAEHDNARLGVCVRWVQQCSSEPVCICVALLKGHPISPLIRDSHAFALCEVSEHDRLMVKKFEHIKCSDPASGNVAPIPGTPGREDPFISLDLHTLATGSPILKRSPTALDCRVVMHMDFESDHELYIAQVVSAKFCDGSLGANGNGTSSRGGDSGGNGGSGRPAKPQGGK